MAYLEDWARDGIIDTHAARIFLRDDTALKVKKPVVFDYLDFSSLADRHAVLLREYDLNRRTAPQMYRDVVPITQAADGGLGIDGDGTPVEWALRMARFPAEAELGAIAARGGLDPALSRALGQAVYDLHRAAEPREADGAVLIDEILDEFGRAFAALRAEGVDIAVDDVLAAMKSELGLRAGLLRSRTEAGFVRRCHGDLHLGNIVVLQGLPVPFDALEFSERLGTCDVLYDLAFLLMDMLYRGHADAANQVLNAYVEQEPRADALTGLAALPLFLAVRATVRAMVAAQQAAGMAAGDEKRAEAAGYIALAERMLQRSGASLAAVGGLSGTGKTTLAQALAPALGRPLGAVHIRSDVERKRLAGVDPLARLPDTAYGPKAADATYAALCARGAACLRAGHPVILDAVFADDDARARVADLARRFDVPFRGIWLEAPETERARRVGSRRNDASDADARVVRMQAALHLGDVDWIRVSTDATLADTVAAARLALLCPPPGGGVS
ncbi:MAG: AAA family ATPase [Rhodobacteraceae bacterium]|nr:AAA family ATPase [Paracoccaceae bacterium]